MLEENSSENRVLVFQNDYFELYNKIWVQVENLNCISFFMFCALVSNIQTWWKVVQEKSILFYFQDFYSWQLQVFFHFSTLGTFLWP